jgi:xanthine/uracil permease
MYLIFTAFLTTGIATALQVTRLQIMKTPFFAGTELLSVVSPTSDVLPIVFNYASLRFKSDTCPVLEEGIQGPCPDAWGACLEMMLCCAWIQIDMAFVPLKILHKVFPKLITGSLRTLVGVYLIDNGLQNLGGSSNCYGGEGVLCAVSGYLCTETADLGTSEGDRTGIQCVCYHHIGRGHRCTTHALGFRYHRACSRLCHLWCD